ncbi:hypothetical protein JB92DRAFT_3118849 [Gautieria morchelliformis]|nr:hypothetical protein JB92DRAFT_3118849 [Gautieria morchelliformis]
MSPKLDTLPNDVLIRVFKELDACDIRLYSLTCRVFHETIWDSMLLRYHLELAVAGLEDGGTDSRLSIAERLARLKTIANRAGLGKPLLSPVFHSNLASESHMETAWRCTSTRLCNRRGVYTVVPRTADGSWMKFIQLPSAVRGTGVHTWHSDMEVIMREFAMDPAQDLVVIFAWHETPDGQWHTFLIHLCAMSTGARHPCAAEPVLSCVPALLDTQFFEDNG